MRHLTFIAPAREFKHPMFHRMLSRAGLKPDQVKTLDLETTTHADLTACDVAIPMGEAALRKLAAEYDLFRWRGRVLEKPNYVLLPTLLPSELLPKWHQDDAASPLRNEPSRFQGTWIFDVQKAQQLTTPVARLKPTYIVDPTVSEWEKIVALMLKGQWLSFDIETIYKMKVSDEEEWEAEEQAEGAITRISFSHEPGFGVSVSWDQRYFEGIRKLLASDIIKVAWNGIYFDIPRLNQEDYTVNGDVWDGMDAWHMLRPEQPRGLEYVTSIYTSLMPWKHLNNSDPGIYSCIDADAALQNMLGTKADLEANGMWNLFLRHSVKLMPILIEAGQRGNAIDLDYSKSLEEELLKLKEELTTEVQPHIPPALFPRKRYKTKPFDEAEERNGWLMTPEGDLYEAVLVEKEVKVCSHCDQVVGNKTEHMKGGKKNNPCKAADATLVPAMREVYEWDQILPFNLASSDQVKAYVRHFKHPMGKDRKTEADSVNAKHLKKLIAKYPDHELYRIKLEFSKVAKTVSTYIYYHHADENGRIHTTYVNAPRTWRLASRAVNLQNVGKREDNKWAKAARKQIVARPGHCFVQADSTSIEAVMVGWLINDPKFMKMAAKSIHAWLAAESLGWEFNDETMNLIKSEHKGLYARMKTAIYLMLFGGDSYLMHMEDTANFPTRNAAEVVRQKIFAMIPNLKPWQDSTREQAKREGFLSTAWGYRNYFYDVYTYKRDKQDRIMRDSYGEPQIKLGKDASKAIGFRPQNMAGAFMRDTVLLIGASKWRQFMPANIVVHDGYTLEVPTALAEEAANFLIETLTRPIAELGGLRIGCEVEIGPEGGNWADYDNETNPAGLRLYRKVEM